MTSLKSFCCSLAIMAAFTAMAFACAVPTKTTSYKPPPCVKHKGLGYSPVLVSMYISGNYNMKDLKEVQRTLPYTLLNKLNALAPYKYQIADGVKPNLSLYITYTTDSYGHYGAELTGYVFDGDFRKTFTANYVTFDKLDDDLMAQVNTLVQYGWCNNCPSPCNP